MSGTDESAASLQSPSPRTHPLGCVEAGPELLALCCVWIAKWEIGTVDREGTGLHVCHWVVSEHSESGAFLELATANPFHEWRQSEIPPYVLRKDVCFNGQWGKPTLSVSGGVGYPHVGPTPEYKV